MKKVLNMSSFFLTVLMFSVFALAMSGCQKEDDEKNLKSISLGEVTHSAFYAPLYVAMENGYFEEEGLKIDLSLISGANNVTAAVLSGDVEIGFCGPEATIYIYNGGEKDYIKTFAGLTKRDGQFLVSRKNIDSFDWSMLRGKEVLAGRVGGMPELNFENALKNAKIDKGEVDINTSVDFASLTSAFIGGEGDFVNLFEPNATKLVNMGFGYVVANIGEMSGEMPYTAFNARKSYIEENRDTIEKFTRAISKGLEFCRDNDPEKIAEIIIGQFPDTSINDLEVIVKRYKDADSWLETPIVSKELFENLEDIMIDSKQIKEYVPFEDLVENVYQK
ncbi:MAG: ABC transporter substrate-binding protein [Bacilli bacterium]|nr:ABC transporter substrate-binding protein [Bacilli bacterium]